MVTALDQLTRNIDRFPTIPQVALKVIRELEAAECDMEQVAERISLDPVLAARVIKLANSPISGAEWPARSVKQAVVRQGTKETRNTIQAVAVMNALPQLPDPLTVIQFWCLGPGTALSARILQAWEFPADVIEGVQYPLQAEAAPQDPKLASLVFAGDRISRDLQLGPDDRSHEDQAWSSEMSPDLLEQRVHHGYPDISFYLIEQHEFMRYVADTVRSTFS